MHEQKRPGKLSFETLATDVIDSDLCCRCGICVGFCPSQCIGIDDYGLKPFLLENKTCLECGRCLELCPGRSLKVENLYSKVFQRTPDQNQSYGIYKDFYVGRSEDIDIWKRAAGGGIITQILNNLLENKVIDAAIIAGFNESCPYMPEGKIIDKRKQLIECSNSIYICIPVAAALRDARRSNLRVAFVGLPCAVAALRKAGQRYPRETENIVVLLGLFCGINIGQEATLYYLDTLGVDKGRVAMYSTRTKEYGYGIDITLKDARKIEKRNVAIHLGLSPLFTPRRCQICPDMTNEFADISVGDTWQNDGKSIVIVRTDVGRNIMKFNTNLRLEAVQTYNRHSEAILNKRIRADKILRYLRRRKVKYTDFGTLEDLYPKYDWSVTDKCLFYLAHLFSEHILRKGYFGNLLLRDSYLSLPVKQSKRLQYLLVGKYALSFNNKPIAHVRA